MNAIQQTTLNTFDQDVLQSSVPVLVDFYADWCSPCRMLSPILGRLATEFSGQVKIVKVNIDAEPGLAQRYQVSSIPTLLFALNGRVIGRTTGLVAEGQLREAFKRLVEASSPQRHAD